MVVIPNSDLVWHFWLRNLVDLEFALIIGIDTYIMHCSC